MITTVDIEQAKVLLPKLLDLAKEGHEVFISEGNTPVARLMLVESAGLARKARTAGLHADAICVSDDFDDELPEGFWLGTS